MLNTHNEYSAHIQTLIRLPTCTGGFFSAHAACLVICYVKVASSAALSKCYYYSFHGSKTQLMGLALVHTQRH